MRTACLALITPIALTTGCGPVFNEAVRDGDSVEPVYLVGNPLCLSICTHSITVTGGDLAHEEATTSGQKRISSTVTSGSSG